MNFLSLSFLPSPFSSPFLNPRSYPNPHFPILSTFWHFIPFTSPTLLLLFPFPIFLLLSFPPFLPSLPLYLFCYPFLHYSATISPRFLCSLFPLIIISSLCFCYFSLLLYILFILSFCFLSPLCTTFLSPCLPPLFMPSSPCPLSPYSLSGFLSSLPIPSPSLFPSPLALYPLLLSLFSGFSL